MDLATFRYEIAETLCRAGIPMGPKRGRQSSSLNHELEAKKRKANAAIIPSQGIRTDETSHWPVYNDVRQRYSVTVTNFLVANLPPHLRHRHTIVFIRDSVGGQMPEGMVPLGTVAGYQAAYKEEGPTVVVRFIRIEGGSQ
ncbi:hypothetical protein QE152_g34786 [Popillia japonica]|uniref:Uncharacterized protein n=1 Tax=Popillia japonica TaxID=7064 RepID=A0AAW1ISQ5_POPJA